ncbi:hypothetical protein [Halodesulfurarchaeum formicicum]|uniref:hypothetical protein n=1 Tax=Halodesulfurarchaeum formicicum TaxID=1873524 RepID=UPI0011E066BE|nr:hypothetical protein [Halodesulfurarchaeum formicicum]
MDSAEYVDGDSIKWAALAGTLVSSYVLVALDGLTNFLFELLTVPATLLESALTWLGETLGLGFTVPAGTIEQAWAVVADQFPIAGPFDWILGVVVLAVFFIAVNWMVDRVREGL